MLHACWSWTRGGKFTFCGDSEHIGFNFLPLKNVNMNIEVLILFLKSQWSQFPCITIRIEAYAMHGTISIAPKNNALGGSMEVSSFSISMLISGLFFALI